MKVTCRPSNGRINSLQVRNPVFYLICSRGQRNEPDLLLRAASPRGTRAQNLGVRGKEKSCRFTRPVAASSNERDPRGRAMGAGKCAVAGEYAYECACVCVCARNLTASRIAAVLRMTMMHDWHEGYTPPNTRIQVWTGVWTSYILFLQVKMTRSHRILLLLIIIRQWVVCARCMALLL